MKTIFRLSCFAFIAFALSAIFVAAQQTRELRTITGNYNDTATIAPTIERIKSLKLPADKPHAYHFQIFALDTKLNLPSGFNLQALLDAMKGHVVAKGETVGMYQRKPDVREKK